MMEASWGPGSLRHIRCNCDLHWPVCICVEATGSYVAVFPCLTLTFFILPSQYAAGDSGVCMVCVACEYGRDNDDLEDYLKLFLNPIYNKKNQSIVSAMV